MAAMSTCMPVNHTRKHPVWLYRDCVLLLRGLWKRCALQCSAVRKPAGMAPESQPANGERTSNRSRQFGKRPERPDFTARDAQLQVLKAKVDEYLQLSKSKTAELEALQNENKANSKLESLKRGLANTVHSRTQTQVRLAP